MLQHLFGAMSQLQPWAGENCTTRKMVPIKGELAQSLEFFYVHTLGFKNKIERRKRRQNNRPIILPIGK